MKQTNGSRFFSFVYHQSKLKSSRALIKSLEITRFYFGILKDSFMLDIMIVISLTTI